MATQTLKPSISTVHNTPVQDMEPDDKWKHNLHQQIEDGLSSMVTEAKRNLDRKLSVGPVDAQQREILGQEYHDAMQNIRRIAQDQFSAALQRERQERRWAAGAILDHEAMEALRKEQQGIFDNIKSQQGERSQSKPSQDEVPPNTGSSPNHDLDDEYFPRSSNRVNSVGYREEPSGERSRHDTGPHIFASSPLTERLPDQRKPPAFVDEPEEMERLSQPPPPPLPPPRIHPENSRPSRRPSSNSMNKPVPEIWKPVISPEEDAMASRSYVQRRGSTASVASSLRSPTSIAERPPGSVRVGESGTSSYRPPSFNPERPLASEAIRGADTDISSSYRPSSSFTDRPPDLGTAGLYRSPSSILERPSEGGIAGSYRSTNPIHERSSESIRPGDFVRPAGLAHRPDVADITHIEREKPRGIDTEASWSGISRSREKQPQGQVSSQNTNVSSTSTSASFSPNYHTETREYPIPSPSPIMSATMAAATRPVDIPVPPHIPIPTKRSFARDGSNRFTPSQGVWNGPSISPSDLRYDQRSPATPDESMHVRQQHLRTRLSTQQFPYGALEGHYAGSQPQPIFDEESDESDEDLGEWQNQNAHDMLEDIAVREAETKRKEEEIKLKEMQARRKEEEAKRKEAEAKRKEEEARKKEEDARKKEVEAKKKEEEARRKEAEAKRKVEEARLKDEETRRKEEDIKKREEEVKRREEELNRREEESKRREAAERRKEEEKIRLQQEEIRKRTEERKRQNSLNADANRTNSSTSPPSSGPWPIPNRSGHTPTSSASEWASSSARSNTAGSAWTSTSRQSSTSNASSTTTGTSWTSSTTNGAKATNNPPISETEWARRQAEQAKKQQEQFRKEQERLERERQAKAGKVLTKEEVIQLFEVHERQWTRVKANDDLTWDSFPWPMLKWPNVPEDLTSTAIGAYVLSPHHLGDKTKSSKDIIKEHIRKWHPDRFETMILPKVKEEEKEKVQQGAGWVVRGLNDLLTRSNVRDMFS